MATKKKLIDRWKHEPWRSVNRYFDDFCMEMAMLPEPWKDPDSEAFFAKLEGLPFREEVPSGRDLRGSTFNGAKSMDLRETDFSYCRRLGVLEECDLYHARLDHVVGEAIQLRGHLDETGFMGARLRRAWMNNSKFERCCFDKADLRSAILLESDLRGSSFREAKCAGADFQKCDLRGCDFEGADLSDAMFRAVKLDATTNLRGARLYDLVCDEHRDFSGRLVLPGTDWRQATWDDTTLTGSDPTAIDRLILQRISKEARREKAAWADDLAKEARRLLKVLKKDPNFKYYEVLLNSVETAHRLDAEDLIQRVTLAL